MADYRTGAYLHAQQQAIGIHRTARGIRADQAAYLAGLCAYERGDFVTAREWLEQAARSPDRRTSGQALAVLGLTLEQTGRDDEAALRFADAAKRLEGEDARQASRHASTAYQAAGNRDAARIWADEAVGIRDATGFAIQVGAFQERGRAERAAGEADGVAREHGYEPARIVPCTDDRGRMLYVVQFGRFATRDEASAARSRIGQLQFIVASMAPRS